MHTILIKESHLKTKLGRSRPRPTDLQNQRENGKRLVTIDKTKEKGEMCLFIKFKEQSIHKSCKKFNFYHQVHFKIVAQIQLL